MKQRRSQATKDKANDDDEAGPTKMKPSDENKDK
jgi:hypothetical protein